MNRLVSHLNMQRLSIGVRIDGDRLDAHLLCCLDYATGNFAPVCDQDLVKHGPSLLILIHGKTPRQHRLSGVVSDLDYSCVSRAQR